MSSDKNEILQKIALPNHQILVNLTDPSSERFFLPKPTKSDSDSSSEKGSLSLEINEVPCSGESGKWKMIHKYMKRNKRRDARLGRKLENDEENSSPKRKSKKKKKSNRKSKSSSSSPPASSKRRRKKKSSSKRKKKSPSKRKTKTSKRRRKDH